ncbi:NAD(P)-dependent dehydrogenase (short-subunit alcohol dehydrogenase family) [Actinomadura pelletieri DSM 43383]|uniref:NAD(P)-dependent dehydrogenase (Short-subunit alcohol dehydrogenase family) n=1 Tax=Actinomadura pelletieri DSM 43383 TaxID=1120940 RepID=A0A495QTB0_9ACTN|nr:3-(cis-5,6-dihydroxycyclohexa-1,3-dien-1-yl)propanoate dehydrogenase [Actinomadura pelletieri]RKS76683.1 NAD(P)-dependent dehydrogenase (short-subunit alcohol dehydrogenase family) [Actinomadura pelletieri DSM 43383]
MTAQQRPAGPPGRLDGRVALVTGGGSGIGRAVVDRYVAEGARVGVLERDAGRADALTRDHGDRVTVEVGDVRAPESHAASVARTLEAFGRLDAYVANAGVYDYSAPFEDMDGPRLTGAFDELFRTNVLGPMLGAHAALPALRSTGGTLIFTVSSSGLYAGGGGTLYVASKHAVIGLIRQLAHELAPDIRVNGVAPGATRTALAGLDALGSADHRLDERLGRIARHLPLGFVSDPDDHAGLYVLLADPRDSRFMTGTVLPSDGGLEVRGGRTRTEATR